MTLARTNGPFVAAATFLPTVVLAAVVVAAAAGCGSGTRLAVDPELAERCLAAFLDAWKAGRTDAELKAGDPPIIVLDPAFLQGEKLADARVVETLLNDGVNLHVDVELTMADRRGPPRRVVYVVGTEPVVTIGPR